MKKKYQIPDIRDQNGKKILRTPIRKKYLKNQNKNHNKLITYNIFTCILDMGPFSDMSD